MTIKLKLKLIDDDDDDDDDDTAYIKNILPQSTYLRILYVTFDVRVYTS